MRIGQWTVRVDGWHLVFEPVFRGPYVWTNAGCVDLSKYYSREQVEEWERQIRDNLWGV